ncbi:type VI secretion system contractile sheath large subunit [Acanthopleuribacter pedis]|uniref:Type VI secretion system contractile sheath large subunit n=1 Tax=Acanthopleuribacter pedis TaxID=442870 RepID=A0A8J7Q222_9BACT|nr:type VI secretion system contractile sheath large subunit [Acanthopleuribacter pedis]MBO1319057.1 type VI secretion system contractile sheath large subunit [Acanthopleuribacter pedis]
MSTKDRGTDGNIPVDKTAPIPVIEGTVTEGGETPSVDNMSEAEFRALLGEDDESNATPPPAPSPTGSETNAAGSSDMLDMMNDIATDFDESALDNRGKTPASSQPAVAEAPAAVTAPEETPKKAPGEEAQVFDEAALEAPFDENMLNPPEEELLAKPEPAGESDEAAAATEATESETEEPAEPVQPEEPEETTPPGPAYGSEAWDRALRVVLDQAICHINEKVAAQTAEIVHHPDFQHLQSCWLGVHMLCEKSMGRSDCEIEILDISKDSLMEDFDEYLDPSESGLFYHLYKNEYDQAGGKPFSAILMHYEFTHKAMDLRLMKMISMVAAACHCPAVGNAGAGLFSKRSIRDIEEITDFNLHFNSGEFTKWRSFREAEDTRYMALTLPRIKIHKRRTILPPRFCREWVLRDAMHGWIPSSYGFGLILLHSFLRHGWCIYIRGPRTGGLLGDIVPADMGTKGFTTRERPLEVSISDQNEHEIAAQGFIPFTYYKDWDRICLFSAPSLQKAERKVGGESTFDRIAASMAYLFLVCRLAHFTKVIQRENIGTTKEAPELEREINGWLKGLITKMPNPEVQLRSMYPLRDGMVSVTEDPSSPGFYRAKLVVQPHLQLEGVNAELTLISKMPREKEQ